jgi:WD40 repeat protein
LVFSIAANDVVFLDAGSLEDVRRFRDLHDSGIRHIEISNDGSMFVTGGEDGFAKVWDIETGRLLHTILVDVNDRVQAVAFTSDDSRIVTTTLNGPIRIYDLSAARLLAASGDRLVREFTPDECGQYFPDSPCPTLEEMKSS